MNKDRKNRIDKLNLTVEELMSLVNDHPDLLNLVDQKQYIQVSINRIIGVLQHSGNPNQSISKGD